MSVKIRISYERPEELREVLARLGPVLKGYKVAREQRGRYRQAYAELKPNCGQK